MLRAALVAGGSGLQAADAAEDEKYGKGRRGEELPAELARRESRLAKIRAAKAESEGEARRQAEEQKAAAEAKLAERREQEARTGQKARGREPRVPDPEQAVPMARFQSPVSSANSFAGCTTAPSTSLSSTPARMRAAPRVARRPRRSPITM